jgi:hypothetical protein
MCGRLRPSSTDMFRTIKPRHQPNLTHRFRCRLKRTMEVPVALPHYQRPLFDVTECQERPRPPAILRLDQVANSTRTRASPPMLPRVDPMELLARCRHPMGVVVRTEAPAREQVLRSLMQCSLLLLR